MLERINIFFLHGFLGRPKDWDRTIDSLGGLRTIFPVPVDYMNDPRLNSEVEFSQWAKNFNEWVQKYPGRNVLVGYSLGGRLAMHSLELQPSLWEHVFLLSANPGFDDESPGEICGFPDREARWLKDSEWALLFKQAPWESLVKSWNNQPVFKGSVNEPERIESDYDRGLLELALTHWSLAVQKNMRPVLKEQARKISWLTGEMDIKFQDQALQLQSQIPEMNYVSVSRSSHRIPMDSAIFLAQALKAFCHKFF